MLRAVTALLLSSLLLFAGTPWSVRSHWCGGQLAERSFWGAEVGCGMESDDTDCANETATLSEIPCCSNTLSEVEGLPSFVKITAKSTQLTAPFVVALPVVLAKALAVDVDFVVPPAYPPEQSRTGRQLLVRIQRYLI